MLKKLYFYLSVILLSHSIIAMEKKSICYSCIPFEERNISIAKSKLFKAVLDPRDQKTPGRMFLETIEHLSSLSNWTDEHWKEFGRFVKAIQKALKEALDPDEKDKLINIECKMNLAGQEGTHTHFHILPRYRNPIKLTDPESGEVLIFKDDFYGRPYDFDQSRYRKLSISMLLMIIKLIQNKLDLSELPESKLKS